MIGSQNSAGVDDYWMSLARSALKAVLKDDAARHGYGALPMRVFDTLLDLDIDAIDMVMLNSEDESAREFWREYDRAVSKPLRPTMLVVVKTVLTSFPQVLIALDDIPRVVDEFQFSQV